MGLEFTAAGLAAGEHATAVHLSTIADSIVALRYFDLESEIRRAILVLKVRGSSHVRAMHDYEIRDDGMHVIGPIQGVRGILAGLAEVTDGTERGDDGKASERAP